MSSFGHQNSPQTNHAHPGVFFLRDHLLLQLWSASPTISVATILRDFAARSFWKNMQKTTGPYFQDSRNIKNPRTKSTYVQDTRIYSKLISYYSYYDSFSYYDHRSAVDRWWKV